MEITKTTKYLFVLRSSTICINSALYKKASNNRTMFLIKLPMLLNSNKEPKHPQSAIASGSTKAIYAVIIVNSKSTAIVNIATIFLYINESNIKPQNNSKAANNIEKTTDQSFQYSEILKTIKYSSIFVAVSMGSTPFNHPENMKSTPRI